MIEAPTLPPGTRVNDVEARLQVIEDIEAVKKAMFRYYRCLDFKLFDELGDCFTQDVTADYGMPGWGAEGREVLVDFLAANESREDYREPLEPQRGGRDRRRHHGARRTSSSTTGSS